MIQICRAEDGEIIQLDITLWDLESANHLESFLEEKIGVPQDDVLAYLSDGRRLHKDSIRDLAGVQDQTIYVFNKRYLDLDVLQVLGELRVEPPLQPPIEDTITSTPPFRPSQLASSYLHTAETHYEHIQRLATSMRYQQEALRIASSSLDLHVLAISDVFEGIASIASRELDKQAVLLAGVSADLEIVERVPVHREFLSEKVRRAQDAGERARTLGDYVSRFKMQQVAESCVKTHEELQAKCEQVHVMMSRLNKGAEDVRIRVNDQSLLEDAAGSVKRSQGVLDNVVTLERAAEKPTSSTEKLLQELRQSDLDMRTELQYITELKNSYTDHHVNALRRISLLNNDLTELPPAMSTLQSGLKAKTSFSHIQRLHSMLYAYGSTVVEIVRRKEFARFFYQRTQSILEVMAKLSAGERKRRQVYRGEVNGLLPFTTPGMDDAVPSIDFSPSGSPESAYTLERADIDALQRVLDDLEHFAHDRQDEAALNSVREARTGLERLIGKMDNLESGFDRIAERSLLSASRLTSHRRRPTEDDIELELQVQELRQAHADSEAAYQRERSAHEEMVAQLKAALEAEQVAHEQLERELHSAKAQLESESTSRRILEDRNTDLSSQADGHRDQLTRALAEATEQTKAAEILRQELAQVHAEFKHVKAIEKHNADKVAALLEEQALTFARLEAARARGEDLEMQIKEARTESEDVKRALMESGKEKERLLRAQATEHDRVIRDHIAEADGDRAVLEHQFSELKAALEDTERQLKDARAQADMALSDTVGSREEVQRVEHLLREAQHLERVLRDDLRQGRVSQADYEHRLDNSDRLVAQILDVALAFRDSHVKALMAAQAMSAHPGTKAANHATMTDSILSNGRHGIVNQFGEPLPIDPSDPAAALDALRAFDHDHFIEAINKAGSTIRKWQKQCKEYRERSKGKISFRNFTKGDLALFLPTRNSVSKPWAAFNVSFPHYFLQATGQLAEQLKTREWIVARITSMTERVVDHRDPDTNPYGLGDGVKYYMLEVEDWTQPGYPTKRRESGRKPSEIKESTSPPIPSPPLQEPGTLPPGPPENEVEDAFSATRPPTSRLFPVRTRANSSPTAGPSSLSRLLAQAPPPEMSLEFIPASRPKTPSPAASPRPPPSPTHTGSVSQAQTPHGPSYLRPGSRASRASTSSKFSGGRIPFGGAPGIAKAVATTAISEQAVATVSPSIGFADLPQESSLPSPEESPTEGMSSLMNRRRTTSYHVTPRNSSAIVSTTNTFSGGSAGGSPGSAVTASSRLASLATSWGVAFGRRTRLSVVEPTVTSPADRPGTPDPISPSHVLENMRAGQRRPSGTSEGISEG
ncbi:hypothetical protein POSPLADRAFT_1057962 [Postia placenta MAD-698-R-SB12]|uniref:Autophagy-related protein 11 n=1 Tax=Postia placenta MAD-698-R-SB12 TaxID=670580 RepID=A0A1X6MXD2_9APHY|nr:hypothetical protein POSPLADRAFT_1057962 [Postia placenta MAD-698-R-SB12]OSX61021.1 hypothetical protein POSPLADRAFT_1057962 [Postia placenta MAD-698-R-SB12]